MEKLEVESNYWKLKLFLEKNLDLSQEILAQEIKDLAYFLEHVGQRGCNLSQTTLGKLLRNGL